MGDGWWTMIAGATLTTVAVLAVVSVIGARTPSAAPKDYEDCAAAAARTAADGADRRRMLDGCDVRFPARRNPAGGYVFYDMLQDRSFEIMGPRPTLDEQKRMDRAYMDYLDRQRRKTTAEAMKEMEAATPAAADAPQVQADGPVPLPAPRPRRARIRPDPGCSGTPLMCAWAKMTSDVKTLLLPQSSGQRQPQPSADR